MKEIYVLLKENYCLRAEEKFAIIFCKEFEKLLDEYQIIPLEHYGILSLLNGEYTINVLIEVYKSVQNCNHIEAEKAIRYVLKLYKKYIVFSEYKVNRCPVTIQYVREGNGEIYKSKHRLSAPLLLSLVLTYQCECYCKYCFVNANGKEVQNVDLLNTTQIKKVLDEASECGIYAINVTGGDPFTRKDIFEILEYCVRKGFCINISTKVLLEEKEIEKLIVTGIPKLQISLDSYEDIETKELIGIEGYASKMLKSIQRLVEAGIEIYVNTVVTKINIKSIPHLMEILSDIGVRKHYITPYLRTLGRHDEELFPSIEDYEKLTMFINKYSSTMEVDYHEPDFSNELTEDTMLRCSGGRMGLVVIPNGKVTVCERLISTPECIIGDVKEQTLMEIWNGKSLHELLEPSKEKFIGTECYECEKFEECVLDKGICYARCQMIYQKIYQRDPMCPLNENKYRFV